MEPTLIYSLAGVGISFVLTMLALIDIIRKDFGSLKAKFIWHLIAIIPVLGWIIYFIFGAKKGKKQSIG